MQPHLQAALHLGGQCLDIGERRTGIGVSTIIELAKDLDASKPGSLAELIKHGQPIDGNGNRVVPAHLVTAWAHRLLRWVDLVQNARALARSMAGRPAQPLQSIPLSPILDQVPQLEAEAVTPEELRHFLFD